MIVAGTSASQLMVSIGTLVWGTNIATMIADGDRDRGDGLAQERAILAPAVGVVRGQFLEQRHRGATPGRRQAWHDVVAGGLDRADEVVATGDVGQVADRWPSPWRG